MLKPKEREYRKMIRSNKFIYRFKILPGSSKKILRDNDYYSNLMILQSKKQRCLTRAEKKKLRKYGRL